MTTANSTGMDAYRSRWHYGRQWGPSASGWYADAEPVERLLLGLAGGGLIAFGASRRSVGGALLMVTGGLLAYHAITGRSLALRVVGADEDEPAGARVAAEVDRRRQREFDTSLSKDVVEEASEESFPASDPPSWTPTAGEGG